MQVKNRFVEHRRNPDEKMNKAYSIYNQCQECVGWESDSGSLHDEVARCEHEECPLWPHRLSRAQIKASYRRLYNGGTLDHGLKIWGDSWASNRDRTVAIRRFCTDCQCIQPRENRDAVRECLSPQCHLYGHRA